MTTSTSVRAPEGQVWFCPMCGKSSPTQDGWEGNNFVGERGWDVSCFIHSYLIPIEVLNRSRKEQHGN
jgi:hypothetical protein